MSSGGLLWARISIIALFGIGGAVLGGALMASTVSIVEPTGDKMGAVAGYVAIVAAAMGFLPATLTGAVFGFSGSGVKSSPGLIKRSVSNLYCLSCKYR